MDENLCDTSLHALNKIGNLLKIHISRKTYLVTSNQTAVDSIHGIKHFEIRLPLK